MKTKKKYPTKQEAVASLAHCLNAALAAGGDTIGYGDGMIPLRCEGFHPMVADVQDEATVTWEPATPKMAELRESKYGEFVGYIKIVYPWALNSRMCPVRKHPIIRTGPPIDDQEFATEEERVTFEWTGTVQEKGQEIILAKPSSVKDWVVVLAKWRGEYVVWNMNETSQEFQSGRYFQTLSGAKVCYKGAH